MIWCPPVFGGHFMHQSTVLQKVHRNSRLHFFVELINIHLRTPKKKGQSLWRIGHVVSGNGPWRVSQRPEAEGQGLTDTVGRLSASAAVPVIPGVHPALVFAFSFIVWERFAKNQAARHWEREKLEGKTLPVAMCPSCPDFPKMVILLTPALIQVGGGQYIVCRFLTHCVLAEGAQDCPAQGYPVGLRKG